MSFRVLGTGMYVPPRVVTNDDLSQFLETNDEWITQRVGVKERHISTNETAADMGAKAARAALENSGVAAEEIDLILAASVSGESISPSVSCMIQNLLGLSCMTMDINAACSAFDFLLETAAGFFARGKVKKVLVIGAERLSRLLDWNDRGTAVIFGDGAGAVVIEKGEGKEYYSHSGAEGDMLQSLYCKNFYDRNNPYFKGDDCLKDIIDTPNKERYLQMDGKAVYKFAVDAMANAVEYVCEHSGISLDDIDLVIPHQANIRIIQSALKKMNVDLDKVFTNLETHGNTSSSCIPMCLAELDRQGRLKRGMKICLVGFGAGLTYGATIFEY